MTQTQKSKVKVHPTQDDNQGTPRLYTNTYPISEISQKASYVYIDINNDQICCKQQNSTRSYIKYAMFYLTVL